jgi:hypothetical protein
MATHTRVYKSRNCVAKVQSLGYFTLVLQENVPEFRLLQVYIRSSVKERRSAIECLQDKKRCTVAVGGRSIRRIFMEKIRDGEFLFVVG